MVKARSKNQRKRKAREEGGAEDAKQHLVETSEVDSLALKKDSELFIIDKRRELPSPLQTTACDCV